ncbi:hypothetical protein H5410_035790 [Solanum commersonii]|uniref:Uncharacterized protein n=1 Tax=Solanum commersonii TaxID=4109 RepID=A0A9J5Y683_SOLCO|nr:hypothetical protein H5410_035790 [Solanum commersonii]
MYLIVSHNGFVYLLNSHLVAYINNPLLVKYFISTSPFTLYIGSLQRLPWTSKALRFSIDIAKDNGDCKGKRISDITIMELPNLWNNLLTFDPLFAKMHHTKSPNFPNIFLFNGHSNPSLLELKLNYDYYFCHSSRLINLSPKFHISPMALDMSLIVLCNRFICLLWSLCLHQ